MNYLALTPQCSPLNLATILTNEEALEIERDAARSEIVLGAFGDSEAARHCLIAYCRANGRRIPPNAEQVLSAFDN